MTENRAVSAEPAATALSSALRSLADRIDAGELAPTGEVSSALRQAADELGRSHQQADAALVSALRWKERAVSSWADSSRGAVADRAELVDLRGHAHELATELTAIRQTLSWRVTAPLRGVRRLRPGRAR